MGREAKMEDYMFLINIVFLIVVGIIIGIVVIVMIMNGKISKLDEKVTQINNNLQNTNWNCSQDFYYNPEEIKNSKDKVKSYPSMINMTTYKRKVEAQVVSTSEMDLLKSKRKSSQTIGIVFCRNCASQFTSDKNECPICGAKRF
jgi:uncharacterized membrane protein YgaE (UPF0421/DUF939 family)